MLPLTEHTGLSPEQRAALRQDVASLGTLQDVVQWGFSHTPPRDVANVVVQDEYCHDVDADEHGGGGPDSRPRRLPGAGPGGRLTASEPTQGPL